jgi:hypothetical protein
LVELNGENLVHLHFLRNLVIEVDLGGKTHVDQIWNLINFPMDLESSLRLVIGNLRNLLSLSVRFRVSHNCASQMTQTDEVLCTSFQRSRVELMETLQNQCYALGRVYVSAGRVDHVAWPLSLAIYPSHE